MTQDSARETREFSAKEGVYTGGSLRFLCKDKKFGFTKELRVSRIGEKDGVVTWSQGNFVHGTSSESAPMRVALGGVDLKVTTTLVKNQHGTKVLCSISGVVPQNIYDAFSVKPIAVSLPKKKEARQKPGATSAPKKAATRQRPGATSPVKKTRIRP
jgi:hypothetical protein